MRCSDEHLSICHNGRGEFNAEAWNICCVLGAGIKQMRDIASIVSPENGWRWSWRSGVLNGIAVVQHPDNPICASVGGNKGSGAVAERRNALRRGCSLYELSGIVGELLHRTRLV